jgi:hypothetical protein
MTDTTRQLVDGFAGLRRDLEIGIALAPSRASAVPAAKALAAFLDEASGVPARLAGLAANDSRVLITLAINMGSIDDIKTAGPGSRAGVRLLQRIVDDLACYDPAFVAVPAASTAESRLAAHVVAGHATVQSVVRSLASVG